MSTVIPKTNISMRAVRSVLFEGTRSLWALCHSPKINKFCKFRPGRTEKGSFTDCFPVDVGSEQKMKDLLDKKCSFMPITLTKGAKLADFAGYDHSCVPPISVGMPEKLYKNRVNSFTLFPVESSLDKPQFGFTELYSNLGGGKWYTAVMLLKSSGADKVYIAEEGSPSFVDIDLTNDPFVRQGDTVTALVAITDLPRKEIEVSRVFSSVWWEAAENYAKKQYTIETAVQPDNYRASLSATGPRISYDEITWDRLELILDASDLPGGTVNWEVWISTSEPRNDPRIIGRGNTQVRGGESKTVVVTEYHRDMFIRPFNVAFLEMKDMDKGGRVMTTLSISET